MVRDETQMIADPPKAAAETEDFPLFAPSGHERERIVHTPGGDDRKAPIDLTPAKGILASLLIGGLMWVVILYALSCIP